jgi:hypothetical protein
MKFSTIVTALAMVLHVPVTVNADRLVRFLFNDGKNDTDSGSCNMMDDILVDGIITLSGYNFTYARKLRSSSYATRNLQYYPPKCRRVCEGFADGTCRATDCVGYRRNLAETSDVSRDLSSGKSFSCDTQVNFINTELDKLVNNSLVSVSCQTLLSKKRRWDCYDDVIYGVVERMVLWQVNTSRTIANSNFSGQSICSNTRVDFEPITNTCVDVLFSTVTGPNGFYKNSTRSDFHVTPITKSIFGSENPQESGIVFPFPGEYTVRSVPDGLQYKAMTIPFTVMTSSVQEIRLWNTNANTIIASNFSSVALCRGRNFNLEFLLSDCSNSVMAILVGPTGRVRQFTDTARPFSLFGEADGKLIGKALFTNGVHNLTIYPDQIMSDQGKSILLHVSTCEN